MNMRALSKRVKAVPVGAEVIEEVLGAVPPAKIQDTMTAEQCADVLSTLEA